MAKLGYTWYPKDWGNSESVFELNLSERGLYRELIDLAMLQDNKVEVKKDVWERKFAVSNTDLEAIIFKLIRLNLIQINDNILFIQSCESRLQLVRGGREGGKVSKPTIKPTIKPFESLYQNNEKPIPKQIEKKEKVKGKRNTFVPPTLFEVVEYFKENHFTEQLAERAFKYYDVADWKDSKGNQVKNWKQKMQSVWFKDEYKVQQSTQQTKWSDPSQIDLKDDDWVNKLPEPPQNKMSLEYRAFCEKWRTRELKEAQFNRRGYYDQI